MTKVDTQAKYRPLFINMTIRNCASGELRCIHSYAVNTVQAINIAIGTRFLAYTIDQHTNAVQRAAFAASRRSPHLICTRRRCKGQICPFSVYAQAATTKPSAQRDGLVVDQIDGAGVDADALAPPYPR